MTKKSTIIALAAVMFTASALGYSGVVLAETNSNNASSWKVSQNTIKKYLRHAPGVMGTVTAINGATLTLTSKNNTTYTVDTTSAKIVKNRNTIITLADIKIGDTIMAQGTVTGTHVVATTVFDGKPLVGKKNRGAFPGIMGIVSNVNGSTFSVTTKENVVYTVAAGNTKVIKGGSQATGTLADIAPGDSVMIRGTVNGTTVTADTIFDGKLGTKVMNGKKKK